MLYFQQNMAFIYSKLQEFFIMFSNIPWNILEPQESFWMFLRVSLNNLWHLFKRSPESSWIFPGMFPNIPRNIQPHSLESFWTFPGIAKWYIVLESSMRFPEILVNSSCHYYVPAFRFPILYFLFYIYLKDDWNSKNLMIPLNKARWTVSRCISY